MSIEKIDSYSAICDHCGEVLETSHEGFTIFVDEQSAQEEIDRADWYTEDEYEEPDLHYCKSCHWVDDNDEMHLRMERRKDIPDTNPVDMPSRPVEDVHQPVSKETEEEDRVHGWFNYDLEKGTETYTKNPNFLKPLKNRVAPPIPESLPTEIPKEVKSWIEEKATEKTEQFKTRAGVDEVSSYAYLYGCRDLATDMYHKIMSELTDYNLADAIKQIGELQASLSEMTSMRDLAKKEYDLTLKEVQTWKDECNTVGALLEGKNVEIARLKDALKWYADHGNYCCDEEGNTLATAWEDGKITLKAKKALEYKKEEQK